MRERKIRGDEKRVVKRKEEKRKEEKKTREREKMEGNERMKLKLTCHFVSSLFVSYVGISFLLFPYSNIYILYTINALTYS